MSHETDGATPSTIDIAIVGGGVAGAYCAWRLSRDPAYQGKSIALFESSRRIGGRLESVQPPGMEHLRAEVGGMRYLTGQKLVSCLIDELQLDSVDFPMGDENNLLYLRRRHLRWKDFSDPRKVPYSLDWNEEGKSPAELLRYAIETAVPQAEQKTAREWQDIKQSWIIDDRNLHEIGFWNLLYKILSSEAYNLVLDALGYFSIVSNWNACEALQWFLADFPKEVSYRTIRDGYDQLPNALQAGFRKERESQEQAVFLEYQLTSFDFISDEKKGQLVRLHFKDRPPVLADSLILAMPKRALQLIRSSNEIFDDEKFQENLASVTAQPAFKLFLGYEYPWWRVLGLNSGRSGTDLPIRQTFYFGTEGEQPRADKGNRNSLLMASYSDGYAVSFWDGLMKTGRNDLFKGQKKSSLKLNGDPILPGFEVTQDLVDMAHYQLRRMHAIEFYIPKPYTAIFRDWRRDPFGGGWHFWNIGTKPWEVMQEMRRPKDAFKVYICGEAYSGNQGWVEGALISAELVLEESFGLSRPSWLPDDYFLGPQLGPCPQLP